MGKSLFGGVCVQNESLPEGGSLSSGDYVQRGSLSKRGLYLERGLCPEGVSAWMGFLSKGGISPSTVNYS